MTQPITRTYTVELTREEYEFLYRLAPDGIQAAMAATLKIRYLESPPPFTEEPHGQPSAVRASCPSTS